MVAVGISMGFRMAPEVDPRATSPSFQLWQIGGEVGSHGMASFHKITMEEV